MLVLIADWFTDPDPFYYYDVVVDVAFLVVALVVVDPFSPPLFQQNQPCQVFL